MKKAVLFIAAFMAMVMLVGTFTGCNVKEKQFIGTWHEINENGEETGEVLVLAKGGEGSISDSGTTGSVKWSVEEDKIFITMSMCGMTETKECTYEISGNKMTLTENDGSVSVYIKK